VLRGLGRKLQRGGGKLGGGSPFHKRPNSKLSKIEDEAGYFSPNSKKTGGGGGGITHAKELKKACKWSRGPGGSAEFPWERKPGSRLKERRSLANEERELRTFKKA